RGEGFYMPEAKQNSQAQYLITHEGGHLDADLRGLIHGTYADMGKAIAGYLNAQGAKMRRMEVTFPEGSPVFTPDPLDHGRPFVAADFHRGALSPNVGAVLASWGVSQYGASHADELYAELYAAYRLGSTTGIVVAVAEAHGWERI